MEEGDIQALARALFVRGSRQLFCLTLDGPDGMADMAAFCADLLARGAELLHSARDPTLLSPVEFAELAACMRRAGFALALAQPGQTDADPNACFVAVRGAGGDFRVHVRITHPA